MDIIGIFCDWALQRYFSIGHCRDILRFGIVGISGGWANFYDWIYPLDIEGIFIGRAFQGYLEIGYYRDILGMDITGIFGGWSLKSIYSRARTISIYKSNNPITRAGNIIRISIKYKPE